MLIFSVRSISSPSSFKVGVQNSDSPQFSHRHTLYHSSPNHGYLEVTPIELSEIYFWVNCTVCHFKKQNTTVSFLPPTSISPHMQQKHFSHHPLPSPFQPHSETHTNIIRFKSIPSAMRKEKLLGFFGQKLHN